MKLKTINKIIKLRSIVLLLYSIYIKECKCFNKEERDNYHCGYCAFCLADEALEGDWNE